ADYAAQASVKRAEGEARAKTTNAEADASVIKMVGGAEAEKTQKIGLAEAAVIKQKAEAINRESYVAIEVARALASSGQKLVPDIVSGGSGGGSSIIELLAAQMFRDKLVAPAGAALATKN